MLGGGGDGEVAVFGGVAAGVGEPFTWRVAAGWGDRRWCGGGLSAESGQELLLEGVEAVPQPGLGGDPAAFSLGEAVTRGCGVGSVVSALPGQVWRS